MKSILQQLRRPRVIIALVLLALCPILLSGVTYAWFSDKASNPVAEIGDSKLQFAIPLGIFSPEGNVAPLVDVVGRRSMAAVEEKKAWYPGETMETTLTVSNPNEIPIVFRIAATDDGNGLLESGYFKAEDPADVLDANNCIFAKVHISDENYYYYGQLQPGGKCDVLVSMRLKGEDMIIHPNTDSFTMIESAIRIDTCQAAEDAVFDVFALEVTQDAGGVMHAIHREGAE